MFDAFPTGLGTASLGTIVALWLASLVLYNATGFAVELVAPPPRRLPDLGHALLPRWLWLARVTDAVGPLALGWTLWPWLVGGDVAVTRWVLAWVTAGFVLSTTLHVGTVIGDSRRQSGFGGTVDSLLSNHTFNFGVWAYAVAQVHGLSDALVVGALAAYGLAVLASREHYTVDVVLAWWCVGFLAAFERAAS